ncbi:MAG: Amuc_1100 family pilus-like protein [Kiritimatiellae bacterium]|nr:Amuc_1100 family pilus-like protein [Kiritimatiellia bacterium]
MNKNKITMCVIGGISLLVVLVFAYLTYSAYTEKGEKLEDLEAAVSRVQGAGRAKIEPSKSSINDIETNRVELLSWKEHALEEAAAGDKYIELNITPSAFRQNMTQQDMKELASKPGGVDGRIAKDDFCFGFDSLKNNNPDASELPILLRQWEDIKFFVDVLSDCGAVEVVSVEKGSAKPPEVKEEPPKRGGKNKKEPEPPKPLADTQSYTIVFTARQVALVKVINTIVTSERFTIIDEFSFKRTRDTLAEALGDKEKDSSGAKAQGGRRRRRGASEEAQAEAQEGVEVVKKGLVVDPASDAPFEVTLKLTTYDFGTKLKAAETTPEEVEQ